MTEAILNNHTNANPTPEGAHSYGELRLLSVNEIDSINRLNELTLLSKRKAKSILRIGNDTLNKIIENGEIKIKLVNGRVVIPFVSLQEYIYNMHTKNELQVEDNEFISEEESVAMAHKILKEFKNGG